MQGKGSKGFNFWPVVVLVVCHLSLVAALRGQGYDAYGGSLNLPCPAPGTLNTHAGIYNVAITSINSSGNVTLAAGSSVWKGEAVVISGTSGGVNDTPAGTFDRIATDNHTTSGGIYNPNSVTAVTISRPLGGAASTGGTLSVRSFYDALVTDGYGNQRWMMCTPATAGRTGYAFFGRWIANATRNTGTGPYPINTLTITRTIYTPQLNKNPVSPTNNDYNYCLNAILKLQGYGFSGWGEYAEPKCKPWTSSTYWQTSDQYPPAQIRWLSFSPRTLSTQYTSLRNLYPPPGQNIPPKNFYNLLKKSKHKTGEWSGDVDPFSADPSDGGVLSYQNWITAYIGSLTNGTYPLTSNYSEYMVGFIDESDETTHTKGSTDFIPWSGQTAVSNANGMLSQNICANYCAPEWGEMVLFASPSVSVFPYHYFTGSNPSSTFAYVSGSTYDTAVESKARLANWLQGNTDSTAATGNASSSGNVVTIPLPAIHTFVPHERITVRSCSSAGFNTVAGTGAYVSGTTPTSTTFTLAGSGSASGVTGCVVTTGPGYTSIGALDTAWTNGGHTPTYTSFGSTATTYTETLGTGKGSSQLYTYTTAHAPSPLTLLIKDATANTFLAGDDGSGPMATTPTQTGYFWTVGSTANSGTITYNTGATSVTLNVPSGDTITVTYQSGGWGSGTGLLDEDGSGSWLPNYLFAHTGMNQIEQDLNDFTVELSKWKSKEEHDAFKAYFPANIFQTGTMGAWSNPASTPVLEGLAPYADLVQMDGTPMEDATCGTGPGGLATCAQIADNQARVNYAAAALDVNGVLVPWYNFVSTMAQQESTFNGHAFSTTPGFPNWQTQALRGAYYSNFMNVTLNTQITSGCNCLEVGQYPIVAQDWWELTDAGDNGSNNNGLFSMYWTPYDGTNGMAQSIDSYGYAMGCFVGEYAGATQAPCDPLRYSNFLGPVTTANWLWTSNVYRVHVSGAAGGGQH